jgi:flagellar motility protein MotE (MotC chaperone)
MELEGRKGGHVKGRGGATSRVNGDAIPCVNGGATSRVIGNAIPRVIVVTAAVAVLCLALTAPPFVFAEDQMGFIKAKRQELDQREQELNREAEKLKALKAELEKRILKYEQILARLDVVLTETDQKRQERVQRIVKAYEAMPSEEAAAKLSQLDDELAVAVLLKMKSKKAGSALAAMESSKAADLTSKMSKMQKNFPARQ